jgi:DnaJ-domain-containing protein 1
MRNRQFHGRFESGGRPCQAPGCVEVGEFRAPGDQRPSFDGPGEYRWFCLAHIRDFNAGYDWFEGMSADEIFVAQSPIAGWQTETRAFRADAGPMPRWADFDDPLDAIGARAAGIRRAAEARAGRGWAGTDGARLQFAEHEQEALAVLGLAPTSDRTALRRRYSELVRRYHPDRNGGDRSQESRLQRVVEAYQVLRRAIPFA